VKPTYFDLTVPDVAQARAFFEKVLHWRFEKIDMPYEYYRIQAGPESEPGIDGGVGSVKNAPLSEGRPMTQVTVPVADLNDVLARVVASGGRTPTIRRAQIARHLGIHDMTVSKAITAPEGCHFKT
jgi:uncharacterized protein